MKTYSPAPKDVAQRVARLVRDYHPDLTIVKFDCVSAVNSEEGAPAVTLHGYPCDAVVRIVGPKDRAMGRGDAEILIDEFEYLKLPPPEQDALLDHEIEHVELVRNKLGRPKLDAQKRPKLKLKLHDVQIGWFGAIARRHGSASMECKQAAKLVLTGKQIYFQFMLGGKAGKDSYKATVDVLPA